MAYNNHTPQSGPGERLIRSIPEPLRAPLALVAATALALSLLLSPAFPVTQNAKDAKPSKVASAVASRVTSSTSGLTAPAGKTAVPAAAVPAPFKPVPATPAAPAPKAPAAPTTSMVGFYVNWDQKSYSSLANNIDKMTQLMPEWYHIAPNGALYQNNPQAQAQAMALIKARKPGMKITPIVNNFGPAGSANMTAIMADPAARADLAQRIVNTMKQGGFQGVNMDLENLSPADRGNLVSFMGVLYNKAHAQGLEVSEDVLAASDTFDLPRLAQVNDYIVPMMYDEHYKGGPSGPVSSQGWYEVTLNNVFRQVPPSKVVVALGSWSYDWRSDASQAYAYTYPEAIAAARSANTPVLLHSDSLNPTFGVNQNGVVHRYWMLDAITMFNHMKAASGAKPRGYAIWRLGAEDPTVWQITPQRDNLGWDAAKQLGNAKRIITFDARRGLITGERVNP